MKRLSIRLLLLAGTIGVILPYVGLTIIFDYPGILREDAGLVLQRFKQGGSTLIITWWLFAWLGFPIIVAYVKMGAILQKASSSVVWLTYIGVAGLIVQIVGLLRWTFVVPVIAEMYVSGDINTQQSSKMLFTVVNQFGGVLLGEHVGQLFTIVWVIGMSRAMHKNKAVPSWVSFVGYASSAVYILGQGELFAIIIPGFPQWSLAGFIGSTLWLTWMLAVAFKFEVGKDKKEAAQIRQSHGVAALM
jgi:hypothetical protein